MGPGASRLCVMVKTESAAWLAETMGKFDERGIGDRPEKEIQKDQVLFPQRSGEESAKFLKVEFMRRSGP